jgi:cation transport regulator ChaC
MDYIFGYGSLINGASRQMTGATGEAVPCTVGGIQRAWNKPVSTQRLTALGVAARAQGTCNGVVFPVSVAELAELDRREGGYRRVVVDRPTITLQSGRHGPDGRFWTYEPEHPVGPDGRHPIAQSYVDVVLEGCLSYGDEFAREFIRTTAGWDASWVDDRSAPRYRRALDHDRSASLVDALLEELVPDAVSRRASP